MTIQVMEALTVVISLFGLGLIAVGVIKLGLWLKVFTLNPYSHY